jgi:hypothetical protein
MHVPTWVTIAVIAILVYWLFLRHGQSVSAGANGGAAA